jgi:cold shock CspA family protein
MLGVVKWFDRVKGFGVIESPEEKEFFIHANEIEDSDYQIEEGQVVSFIERNNNNSGKKSARKCKIVSLLDDFEDLMYYLDKYSMVIIQVKVKRRGPRGNPYTTHELRTVNILKQGVSNILKNNDKDEVFNKITEYFEESLDNNLFLNFCEHIENAVFETFNDKVASKEFVDKLFDHFGNNLNQEILFSCWKSQKFNFIGYNDSLDFQIPENLILQNTPELALSLIHI